MVGELADTCECVLHSVAEALEEFVGEVVERESPAATALVHDAVKDAVSRHVDAASFGETKGEGFEGDGGHTAALELAQSVEDGFREDIGVLERVVDTTEDCKAFGTQIPGQS